MVTSELGLGLRLGGCTPGGSSLLLAARHCCLAAVHYEPCLVAPKLCGLTRSHSVQAGKAEVAVAVMAAA